MDRFHLNSEINVSHLRFADDTLIFPDAKEETVENLVMILQVYEAITGLRVNLEKSTIISIGADNIVQDLTKVMHSKVEKLPFKYLGMPLGSSWKQTSVWEVILDKFKKKNWLYGEEDFSQRYKR